MFTLNTKATFCLKKVPIDLSMIQLEKYLIVFIYLMNFIIVLRYLIYKYFFKIYSKLNHHFIFYFLKDLEEDVSLELKFEVKGNKRKF